MPRFVLAIAVLFCICLISAAPAAADIVEVSTLDELTNNLTGQFTDRTIVVTADIDAKNNVFLIGSGKNITLMPGSKPGISIKRTVTNTTSDWGMFTIQSGGNLTLAANATTPASALTIDGGMLTDNKQSLVWNNGGSFTMQAGTLTNNYHNRDYEYGDGGGVHVIGGTFTMSGGTISDNNAWNGSGVYIDRGRFTMYDGEISGNTANTGGGGVWVTGSGATFTMKGGEISCNRATSSSGGGVYISNGGRFTMYDGEISGNTANTGGGGVWVTGSGATFTMEGGKIFDSNTADYGGGVYVDDGTFMMNAGTISDNTAKNNGGGVYIDSSRFTMEGGEISDNTAKNNGGGVWVTGSGATFTMNAGTISDNGVTDITGDGGGVYVGTGGTFTMADGEISDNTAKHEGGGVYVNDGTFMMTGGKISTNTSGGGSVYVGTGGTFTMADGEISNNTATDLGGGVFVTNRGTFTMNAGTISGNRVTETYGNGGGVYVGADSTFMMNAGTISGNTATRYGGGMCVAGVRAFTTLSGGEISRNTAAYGGGVYLVNQGTFTMSGGKISDNTADSDSGGGMYVETGTFTMSGGEISGNHANNMGGGVCLWWSPDSKFTMTGGTISGNTAKNGGGMYVSSGTFTMTGGTMSGNIAAYGGGVWVTGSGATFTMTGNAEITGNNEVYLKSKMYINVSGSAFTGSAKNISGDTDVIILNYQLIRMTGDLNASEVQDNFALRTTEYILIPDASDKNLIVANPVYPVTVTGGTGSGSYAKDEIVQISATVPSGKTFDHWETTGVTLTSPMSAVTTFVMPAHDVTATAVFKGSPVPPSPTGGGNMDNAFRVLFETNGGSSVPPITGLSYGDTITAPPAPTKDGFTFAGWYTREDLTTEWNFADSITGDMTLYAKWTPLQVTPTATVTVPVTATVTATASAPVVTASQTQEPTIRPEDKPEDRPPQFSLSGFVHQHLLALAAAVLAVLFLLGFFLVRRKTVTFLVPTPAGIKPYRIKVRKNQTINPDRLPDELLRHTWYLDARHTDRWNFDEDTIVESITLYPGET